MKKAIFFVLLLVMAGCANIDPSLTDQTRVYSDARVRKSSLQVAIHPKDKQRKPLTAYFYPFVIQQANDDYAYLGDAFALEFHNAWTEEQLFTIQEFQPGTRYEGFNSGLARARARGADLLIIGAVPYFYSGSTLDDSAITIRLNIYSTSNGALLWTMLQSGRIEYKQPKDWVYVVTETRMPTGPFNMIIRAIARDMAIPLKGWLPDPDSEYEFVSTTDEMRAGLDPRPVPMGPPPTVGKTNALGEEVVPQVQRPSLNGLNLNIEFDFDKATIKPESDPVLDALAEALQSPELAGRKIVIAGHTDSKGSDAYNLALSIKRAAAIKTYLVERKGLDPNLIETVGYGKSRPLAVGGTPEDMQRNRRVEITLAE